MDLSIREALRAIPREEFLERAAGLLGGRVALLISCGPSIDLYEEAHEELESEDPVVLCVKQSINRVGDTCDIHLFNCYNLRRYRYEGARPYVVYSNCNHSNPVFVPFDLELKLAPAASESGFENSLSGDLSFTDHELSRTGLDRRPSGPGIMYEAAFPLLVHLGVARIVTVGWDIADAAGHNTHFHDPPSRVPSSESPAPPRSPASPPGAFRRFLARLVGDRRAHRLDSFFRHHTGRVYNPARMQRGEAECVAGSLPRLRSWLAGRGVELDIRSRSPWMTDD